MKVSIFILAGGKSSRFGENKVYQKIGKETFLSFLVKKMEKLGKVYIVKKPKRGPLHYKNSLLEFKDDYAPLIGIYTALKFSTTKFNVFIPVDMPLISEDLIKKLLTKRENACYKVEKKLCVFPLVLKKEVFLILEKFLKRGEFKLKKVLQSIGILTLNLEKIYYNNYLKNFNYKADIVYLY